MGWKTFNYHWEWQFEASPEMLWPLVADTNRFNRDTGLPPVEERGEGLNARRQLAFKRLGISVAWEEEPFEWFQPYRFNVVRRYSSGPVKEMRVVCQLERREDGGTHLSYEVWAQARNLLGLLAIPIQIGVLSARSFSQAFIRYNEIAKTQETLLSLPASVTFAPGARERLDKLQQRLIDEGAKPDLVGRLIETVAEADDMTIAHLRPYMIADAWGAARREVLELCLVATRLGLLEFQWDLLCPLCRNNKFTSQSLAGVKFEVHCNTCNIDFNVNFERSVELTFRPNKAIRPVDASDYCVAGPQVTPHAAVQQLLPASTERSVQPALKPGRYRLRILAKRGAQHLRVGSDGASELTFRTDAEGEWSDDEVVITPQPTLHFVNGSAAEQLFILERLSWNDQIVTAADVTILQRFRDLFANEALRPGEQIAVGSLVVLFTDLRGSTELYNSIGDAPAFGLVMEHFEILKHAIVEEEGAIVKTIGDAVMAVFRRPVAALRALSHAQQLLAGSAAGGQPLILKTGIHYGPCIAVTLNDRLDYFGSTVNIAARLEGLSSGTDMIVSDTILTDPEVQALLALPDSWLHADAFEANLKGFGDQRFELWRLTSQPSETLTPTSS